MNDAVLSKKPQTCHEPYFCSCIFGFLQPDLARNIPRMEEGIIPRMEEGIEKEMRTDFLY